MHSRRLAALFLGFWISLSLCISVVATQNFAGVDRLINAPDPEAQKVMLKLGAGQARQLLRYQVGALNAYYFEMYGWVQIGLAVLLGLILLFATNGHRVTAIVSAILLLLVVFQHFFLNREIGYLAESLAYHFDPMLESRFRAMHNAFGILEVVKGGLLLLIGGKLLIRGDRRKPIRAAFLPDQETHH